jgi:hypothetical protein
MILDMIQGCRYLRRSTDRWTLSKNSTTRLKDSRVWRKASLLWECFRLQLHTSRVRIYTLSWHDSWWTTSTIFDTKFISKCECLSIHLSLSLGPRHHAIPWYQRKQSPCRTEENCRPQPPLPNLFGETFLLWTDFFTKLGPQARFSPVPNFGVNICPFNYGIKVILFQNWPQLPTSPG